MGDVGDTSSLDPPPYMFDLSWITASATTAVMVVLSALGIYAALILCTRLVGLRSFSKMSSFDFAITIAIGTVLASTLLNEQPTLVQGAVGLGALYGLQFVVSTVRERSEVFSRLVDNQPLLLMDGTQILDDNLRKAKMTRGDLRAKLREANVLHFGQVRAVVLESTGDVTVLHGEADGPALDPDILHGVEDVERLR